MPSTQTIISSLIKDDFLAQERECLPHRAGIFVNGGVQPHLPERCAMRTTIQSVGHELDNGAEQGHAENPFT